MIKFSVSSRKYGDMEKALEKLSSKLQENATKGVSGNWARIKKDEYEVQIEYMFQNRISDRILEHELKKVVAEIDKEAKVKKIK